MVLQFVRTERVRGSFPALLPLNADWLSTPESMHVFPYVWFSAKGVTHIVCRGASTHNLIIVFSASHST